MLVTPPVSAGISAKPLVALTAAAGKKRPRPRPRPSQYDRGELSAFTGVDNSETPSSVEMNSPQHWEPVRGMPLALPRSLSSHYRQKVAVAWPSMRGLSTPGTTTRHFDELIAETWVEFGYKPPGY